MGANWGLKPLGALVEDILDRRGVTPKKLGSDFVPSGHRVISAKLIKSRTVDFAADEPRFVNADTYAKWMRTPLRAGDVLLTSEAPLGELAYLEHDVDWVLGQRLFGIRTDKSQLDGRYLFYALQGGALRDDLMSRATGTTAQGIRQSELRKVMVPLPPLDEQRRIADVLGALDDKIEINRRMNETLEEMARALFKSWFVNFDPVRAKAEGRDTGLPKHLADLFPDRLIDSELGEIPEGWALRELGDLIGLAYGKPLKEDARRDGAVVVVGANGPVGVHDESLVSGPGIVVGRKGTPGVVTWIDEDFYPIDTTFFVQGRSGAMPAAFIFHLLRLANLPALSADSAVPGLNRVAALSRVVLVPQIELSAEFDRTVRSFSARKRVSNREMNSLTQTRDALMNYLLGNQSPTGADRG